MNEIILPMKVHAVKLEYKRQMLMKIPHGYFRYVKGIKTVVINYDPDNASINSVRPRRLRVTSKLGRKYSELITSYSNLMAEYTDLLKDWNLKYRINPPKVNFPIKQYYDPHIMNNRFFAEQAECQGSYSSDKPTISEHGVLKSKNEQFGADLLKQLDIPFKYETSVYIDAIKDTINPDYLVNFYEIDRCAYLEILGLNDKIEYSMRTAKKIYGFSKEKYRPGHEVIYVMLYDKQNFDEDYFVSEVLSAFNNLIPDKALIWDSCDSLG